jgi:hypothetical protein
MSGVSESINSLFNVLICGSFASFWFLQKIKIVGCLEIRKLHNFTRRHSFVWRKSFHTRKLDSRTVQCKFYI